MTNHSVGNRFVFSPCGSTHAESFNDKVARTHLYGRIVSINLRLRIKTNQMCIRVCLCAINILYCISHIYIQYIDCT